MTRAGFFAALHTAAPGSTPEAVQKWIDFAAECVSEEQYANFIPAKDKEANVENWLDTLCGGVYAVRAEYGAELAGKLVNLGLNNCCLYPGEMLQAAECLRDGGNAETISGKIASDEIESEHPFFPVPVHPLTERDCGPDSSQSKGRNGSYSQNFQQAGRELLTPDEVRMLDNKKAIVLIRGEAPVIDDKYDLMKHPAIKFTADGGAAAYIHSPVCLYDAGDLDFSFTSLDDVEIFE